MGDIPSWSKETGKPTIEWIKYREVESIIMSVACKYCKTELPPDHPAVIAQIIEDSVGNWVKFESDDDRWGYPVNATIPIAGLARDPKVVAKKLKPEITEIEQGYFEDSSYPQGTTFEVYVVLQYGEKFEEMFFKKTGTADSYGEIVWDGVLTETKPKVVTVTSWE
jgi:hypothetical protein